MKYDVIERLKSFGFEVTDADDWALDFVIRKVENDICNSCNVDTVPDGLYHIAVDMVCGEFLHAKKSSGQLTGIDLTQAVKQIVEGDTTVTFAVGEGSLTPEQRLDALIGWLMTYGREQFVRYRRLVW